jgi:selenium metabolism protein YedF
VIHEFLNKGTDVMTLLYLNSDEMGRGDSDLGRRLLIVFLENLANSNTSIDLVGCLNSGVSLTTQDGPELDALRLLEKKGAKIASCGTCLDHLNIRDDLKIGIIGNMEMTVDVMGSADRVIAPC